MLQDALLPGMCYRIDLAANTRPSRSTERQEAHTASSNQARDVKLPELLSPASKFASAYSLGAEPAVTATVLCRQACSLDLSNHKPHNKLNLLQQPWTMVLNESGDIDATLLRSVLRVVHCLQKERGSSCAYYASGDATMQRAALLPARRDTDQALRLLQARTGHDDRMKTALSKVRNMIPMQEDLTLETTQIHRVLYCYNTLIGALAHEFILRHTDPRRNPQEDVVPLKRVSSQQFLIKQDAVVVATKRGHHHRVQSLSGQEVLSSAISRDPPARTLPRIDSQSLAEIAPQDQKSVSFEEPEIDDRDRMWRLIKLLHIFVRLKESTGVERATLSSILAIGREDSQLLLNDLILEVENQRGIIEQLAKLPTGPLRNLVEELVTLSPELQSLQARIMSGLNFHEMDTNASRLWDLLTVYIDKLHSLELLIVEEIECCSHLEWNASNPHKQLLAKAFGTQDANELREKLTGMPPADVKKHLLEAIPDKQVTKELRRSNTPTKIEDLLQELSSAPASKEWEIDLYEVKFMKRIGQGTAGTTYLANWSGLKVAVKVASITEMGLDGWRTEVQALQKLHHPNIIRLLGSVYHPNPLTFCLVLEYCEGGDLSTVLQRVTPRTFFFHTATGIAQGMTYLHHRGIIHRDIKPANILVSGDVASGKFDVKVTDFGVATESDKHGDRTAETGTYRWMAPEVIRHEVYSQTADVYSYAVLLWQLITREDPYADMAQIAAAAAVALEFARPPFPPDTPEQVVDLIRRSWTEEPSERPSFDDLVAALTSMTLPEDEQKWMEAPLGHSVYRRAEKCVVERKRFQAEALVRPSNEAPKKEGKRGIKGLFSRKSVYF